MNLPTLEEYIEDFKVRIKSVRDISSLCNQVERGECPFSDCNFENNQEFRKMRRFYHRESEMLKPILLTLINELTMEVT